jgi:hypothetical protein
MMAIHSLLPPAHIHTTSPHETIIISRILPNHGQERRENPPQEARRRGQKTTKIIVAIVSPGQSISSTIHHKS